MKFSILNNEKTKSLLKKAGVVVVCGAMVLSLTGCIDTEYSTNADVSYDIIDTMDNTALEEGITQVLDVEGQPFKLVVNYQCELQDDERWTVTSDKDLNIEIRTDGLPTGWQVYIDNVHTDTTICSYFPTVDGITQDSMDDRIHNSQMMGFPIADDNAYTGINQIEGQNETFIKGFVHGYNGHTSGTITEKRFLESDYLEKAVYANKVASVIDLIVIDANGKTTCVSVKSEVLISVWPFIKMKSGEDDSVFYKYYYFDDGQVKTDRLSEDEFTIKTQVENKKTKE